MIKRSDMIEYPDLIFGKEPYFPLSQCFYYYSAKRSINRCKEYFRQSNNNNKSKIQFESHGVLTRKTRYFECWDHPQIFRWEYVRKHKNIRDMTRVSSSGFFMPQLFNPYIYKPIDDDTDIRLARILTGYIRSSHLLRYDFQHCPYVD
jgi:hypothetical protein